MNMHSIYHSNKAKIRKNNIIREASGAEFAPKTIFVEKFDRRQRCILGKSQFMRPINAIIGAEYFTA